MRENKKDNWHVIFSQKAESIKLRQFILNLIAGTGILMVVNVILKGEVDWQIVLPTVLIATFVHLLVLFFKWNWKI
ncbi:hypothetical protein [Bacillus timonensis]|uniref:hypothetical protein n=1 Tax=Bacillus timonensis TaxID=1033734 RepID=UPI0011DD7DDF|nr:hypothetical protein [Bacillus timonensis]